MKSIIKVLLSVALAMIASLAQAVPCADTSTGVFESGTTTIGWTGCEDGAGSNDPFPSALTFDGMIYDALSKYDWDPSAGEPSLTEPVDINLTVTPTGAATNGTFSFNDIAGYDDFIVVLKDGGTYPDGDQWAAYLLSEDLLSGGVWSGDWIYGYAIIQSDDSKGNLKNISHLSVYGKVGDVPEPGVVALLAIGLIGMVAARRKKTV